MSETTGLYVKIDAQLHARLKARAAKERLTMIELVERMIREGLARK